MFVFFGLTTPWSFVQNKLLSFVNPLHFTSDFLFANFSAEWCFSKCCSYYHSHECFQVLFGGKNYRNSPKKFPVGVHEFPCQKCF